MSSPGFGAILKIPATTGSSVPVAFSDFHPIVRQWFTTQVGEPTSAQLRGWDAIARGRHTLIAAPTGSGKTLAAFLTALNALHEESQSAPLPEEVRVVYVSPLKALSADILKNLAEPRAGIRRLAEAAGVRAPRITAAVRTGDTTPSERAAMLRTPPHILVTTPESLYLLLTSDRSRQMLRTVRTVIVDEIHAVIGSRRGAHLALTLERLAAVAEAPLQRIGLSATQTPIEEVARYLTAGHSADCAIIDVGHRRQMDLGVELPRSTLDAVMSHEVWEEYYDRLTTLITAHKTTLIFVNTRRMAERVARHLSERLGDDAVTAHHGSLSKEKRLDAETRLKGGQLKALVATASLELGIDIGHVDLVCQIGSPHRIATLLQRVGRSGHTITGTPKGRVFPVSRDDLVECAALLRSIRSGLLDAIVSNDAPLDVLAQQIVAETASLDYAEHDLFALVTRAWPYRNLERASFDRVLQMTADGFATRRGRRAALVHRDEVNAYRSWSPGRQAPRPDLGRRHPRDCRLSRGPGTRRYVHRHAQRGFRDRKHGRRHLPAGQRLVADPASGGRRRPGGRREGRTAEHPVLAGRSAGAQRRTVARRQRPASRARSTARRSSGSCRRGRVDDDRDRSRQGRRRAGHCLPRGGAPPVGGRSFAGDARARAFLRRGGRHAARAARPVRQPHQQGLGAGPAQALLPPVQFRAAGRRHRGRADALAGTAALVPPVGRLPLPPPGDDARRAGAGLPRRAGLQDAMAMEHHDLAGRAQSEERAEGRAPDSAHAGGRPHGGRLPGCGRVPREHPRGSADPRSSAGLPNRTGLPSGSHGLRGPARGAGPHSPRRAAAGGARHA